jgi:hypothetical protein
VLRFLSFFEIKKIQTVGFLFSTGVTRVRCEVSHCVSYDIALLYCTLHCHRVPHVLHPLSVLVIESLRTFVYFVRMFGGLEVHTAVGSRSALYLPVPCVIAAFTLARQISSKIFQNAAILTSSLLHLEIKISRCTITFQSS